MPVRPRGIGHCGIAPAQRVTRQQETPRVPSATGPARRYALTRWRPVVLIIIVVFTGVVVERILVFVLVGVRVVVVGALRFRSDAQLRPQPVKVRAAAVVLELASNLDLLGLSSAAPHWLDPLERPEPCGPTMPLSLTRVRDTQNRRRSPLGTSALASFRTDLTVPGLRPR